MISVVLHLVLLMDMVNVVWVLGPPTLPPKKLIVVLMVAILCRQGVGIIHPQGIHTTTCHIIYQISGGRIIMLLLVMMEVAMVLLKPNHPDKKTIMSDTVMMGGFRNIIMSTQHHPWILN